MHREPQIHHPNPIPLVEPLRQAPPILRLLFLLFYDEKTISRARGLQKNKEDNE